MSIFSKLQTWLQSALWEGEGRSFFYLQAAVKKL